MSQTASETENGVDNDNLEQVKAVYPMRTWCYTLNNYAASEERQLQLLECKYHVFGREKSATGTPHLQGCVTFKSPYRFNRVRRLLGGRAHIEVARDVDAARDYCKKDGNFWESGPQPKQGMGNIASL